MGQQVNTRIKMALLFNSILRINPAKPDEPGKWYLILKSLGLMREREVAEEISEETTLNRKEAEMATHQFQKVMVKALLSGKTVQLGELGSFRLTVSSTGVAHEQDVSPLLVKKVNLRFTPSAALKEKIAKATFAPAWKLSNKQ